MATGEIGICAALRHHALLPAQRAKYESVLGLDHPNWCSAASDISRRRGFRWSHGACRMEHLVILRIVVRPYGGNIQKYNLCRCIRALKQISSNHT